MSTRSFVLDAGATIAWAFDEDGLGETLGPLIRDATPVAPWLWRLEVANAILVKERRRIISSAEGVRLLGLLDDLGVEIVGEPATRTTSSLASAARPAQLSTYDAVYLELAMTLALPLLTTDRPLREAAMHAGVALAWKP